MKCSLGISNFLEEISSLSLSMVFLYFFALIAEEGSWSLLAILWNSALRWVCLSLGVPVHFFLNLPTPSHPIPPLESATDDQFCAHSSYGTFPLAFCFIHSNVYIPMLFSQSVPASPSPVCSQVCASFASPLLPCKYVPPCPLARIFFFLICLCQFCVLCYSHVY